jgi:acyl-CoA synthetase (AMP-forming)/AMP-acid ligase II
VIRRLLDTAGAVAHSGWVLAERGLLGPYRPDQLLGIGLAVRRYGLKPGVIAGVQRVLRPGGVAVIDERDQLTFAAAEERTSTLAAELADRGIGEGSNVGVLCRNHRGFVEASVALLKLGANVLYLNTSFAAPQLVGVMEREDATALISDEEFLELASTLDRSVTRLVAWTDDPGAGTVEGCETIDHLMEQGPRPAPPAPSKPGRQVILTSGTTGTPKGAQRGAPNAIDPLVALLSKIPLHTGDTTLIAPPMFHAWGLAHLGLALVLGSTIVLERRFDAEDTLRLIEAEGVTVLVAVPVMLQRIMALPEATRERYDTSSLRVVAVSGSALPGELASRFMDAFGEVIYNLYGSTEVAWATIATPEDLRAAPGSAGRPPRGTVVRIVDEEDHDVEPGGTGRIFVGNSGQFEGYTGGGSKDVLDGLMSTGDVGHFDEGGRLFIDGRDDDMIVSGGENVFPREVEDLLSEHPAVADVAVIGVDDEQFGQRLKAFVVPRGDGDKPNPDELKAHVRSQLAAYKVPKEIVFVDELPRNPTGKVVKRELESS